jgi:hypothetical protein
VNSVSELIDTEQMQNISTFYLYPCPCYLSQQYKWMKPQDTQNQRKEMMEW